MNNHERDNGQFVVSYELLKLLQWLAECDQEGIKKLITKALQNGLKEELMYIHTMRVTQDQEELQCHIVHFFELLEHILLETSQEQNLKSTLERLKIPAIDHIDTMICDSDIMAATVAKTTSVLEMHPEKNSKELLCKELLRQWKPSKKSDFH